MHSRSSLAAVALAVLALAPSCDRKTKDAGAPGGSSAPSGGAPSWAHGTWKFSQTDASAVSGWLEFKLAGDGTRGTVHQIDYRCAGQPGCGNDGTFEATESSVTLHTPTWKDETFRVRTAANVMEWTRNDIVLVHLVAEPPEKPAPPPDPAEDQPIPCKTDADCPKSLACGPCEANTPIIRKLTHIECYRNPCNGHREGYCKDAICVVKPPN